MRELKPWLELILKRPGRLVVGGFLILATLLSGIALLAVSGWFLTKTALVGLLLAAGVDGRTPSLSSFCRMKKSTGDCGHELSSTSGGATSFNGWSDQSFGAVPCSSLPATLAVRTSVKLKRVQRFNLTIDADIINRLYRLTFPI